MTNGHGEETWLDILREWMPSLIAGVSAIVGGVGTCLFWVVRDRLRVQQRLDRHSQKLDRIVRVLENLDMMEEYPAPLTSNRIHELLAMASSLHAEIEATRKQAGTAKKDLAG